MKRIFPSLTIVAFVGFFNDGIDVAWAGNADRYKIILESHDTVKNIALIPFDLYKSRMVELGIVDCYGYITKRGESFLRVKGKEVYWALPKKGVSVDIKRSGDVPYSNGLLKEIIFHWKMVGGRNIEYYFSCGEGMGRAFLRKFDDGWAVDSVKLSCLKKEGSKEVSLEIEKFRNQLLARSKAISSEYNKCFKDRGISEVDIDYAKLIYPASHAGFCRAVEVDITSNGVYFYCMYRRKDYEKFIRYDKINRDISIERMSNNRLNDLKSRATFRQLIKSNEMYKVKIRDFYTVMLFDSKENAIKFAKEVLKYKNKFEEKCLPTEKRRKEFNKKWSCLIGRL